MNITKRFIVLVFFGIICVGLISAQSFFGNSQERMAIYENYGLVYDSEKEAYCYDNKIVGFFVDEQGLGFRILHPHGEIHVKINREQNGRIIGITELSSTEYALLLEAIETWRISFNNSMDEWRSNFERQMAEMRLFLNREFNFMGPNIPPFGVPRRP